MAEVAWSISALDDLEAICQYIERDSPRQAVLFAERVFGAVGRLAGFPRSGRIVPELSRDDVREIIFDRYRVIYRLSGERVEVIMVHHAMRQLP